MAIPLILVLFLLAIAGAGGALWYLRQGKTQGTAAVQPAQETPQAMVPAAAPTPPEQPVAQTPEQAAATAADAAPLIAPAAQPTATPGGYPAPARPSRQRATPTAPTRTAAPTYTQPSQPAPAVEPETPRRQEIPRPEPVRPVAPPRYSGPPSGTIVWSGQLQKNGTITIEGGGASAGTLHGELPGVPVMIDVRPADVGLVESPSPSNGWKKLTLRSRVNRRSVVTIEWTVLNP